MHKQHIHIRADLRHQQPGGPRFGGGDLDALGQRAAHLPDVIIELIRGDIAAILGLVADNDAVDHPAVGQGGADAKFNLLLVLDQIGTDPDAQRHSQPIAPRDFGHLVHPAIHRIGADMAGDLG